MERASRPGRRSYVDHAHLPRIQGGMGTAIVSTSRGVMTGHEARQMGVGGEVMARIW
jgi:small subunit ribosomal protein S8